jgi:hypothetical protein
MQSQVFMLSTMPLQAPDASLIRLVEVFPLQSNRHLSVSLLCGMIYAAAVSLVAFRHPRGSHTLASVGRLSRGATLPTGAVDGSPTSRKTNTTATGTARSEHGCVPVVAISTCSVFQNHSHLHIPQHIRHNEQAHVRATDVYAIQVCDSAVALCDVDVLHLYVHVVLGCPSR